MQKTSCIVIFSLLILSCSKETPSSLDFKQVSDYYPLKLGVWHIYDVDSISYDDFTDPVTIDSIFYQVKEELTDTFFDLEGNLSYEITRYKRMGNDSTNTDDLPWKISDIWWVKEFNGNIERIEENNRYVTLSYPISENKSWDGNAYNYLTSWDYTYKSITDTFGEFSNTVSVIQRDSYNRVDSAFYKEVFAKKIGLVFRSRTRLKSPTNSSFTPIIQKAEKGFQYFQKLNSYYIPE